MYRIFIVEDDSTMAAVMKKQIESWGHSVHVATQFSDILSEFTAYGADGCDAAVFQWLSLVQ